MTTTTTTTSTSLPETQKVTKQAKVRGKKHIKSKDRRQKIEDKSQKK